MSVKSDVEELHKINIDIKRTLESLRKLRKAKRDAEKRVTEYLNEKKSSRCQIQRKCYSYRKEGKKGKPTQKRKNTSPYAVTTSVWCTKPKRCHGKNEKYW